VPGKGLSVFPQ